MNKKHILLVDDDNDFTEVLALRLQTRNYIVSIADDGKSALEKAKEKPDLILLDIMLPEMNGYEVCQKLRQDQTTHDISIIMLTGRDDPQAKIEGLYIGADDYITKPFEAEELFARIEAVLRRKQSFEERPRDRMQLIEEIKRIIDKEMMVPHFQPIFYLRNRRLLGIEVLSRPPELGYFNNPEILFDTAFHLGMLFDLEISCHKKALVKLGKAAKEKLIFFNISPYLIQDAKSRGFAALYNNYTKLDLITLELTERTAIKDVGTFLRRLEFFKESGFKISIDDIGSGYASLDLLVEIKPNFIKIDMPLIRNIQVDTVRQNLLAAIVAFCKKSNIISIAEGVEETEQLDMLVKLGIDAAQGYLLGRPCPEIQDFI